MLTAHELSKRVGYQTPREVDLLHDLTMALEPAEIGRLVAVNIGSGSGTSSLAVLETRKDLILFGIDVNADNLIVEETALQEGEVLDRYVGIHGRSDQVGRLWPMVWLIDFLFVDGDHSADGVRADIGAWLSHLRPTKGIIAFHDYAGWPSDHPRYLEIPWPDIPIAVDEMMSGYKVIGEADRIKAFRMVHL